MTEPWTVAPSSMLGQSMIPRPPIKAGCSSPTPTRAISPPTGSSSRNFSLLEVRIRANPHWESFKLNFCRCPTQSKNQLSTVFSHNLISFREGTDNCLVNVIKFGDEMFATSETNTIRRIDPETLETIGDGIRHSDYLAVHNATAHPHTDSTGTVFNMGSSLHMGVTHHNIIEFPPPR